MSHEEPEGAVAVSEVSSTTAAPGLIDADRRYRRTVLRVTLAGLFASAFPVTILIISVTDIARDLGSSPSTITWVATAPMLVGAVATPLLGRISDVYGNRRLFIVGMAWSGVFAVATALAWDATSLIAFRTLSQLGGAAIVPSTFAMLFRAFPETERVHAVSLASGTLAGATATGIIIGGPIIDWIGWRPIFFIQAAISVAALLPAVIFLRPDRPSAQKRELDVPGAIALAVATFTLTFGINRLGAWGATPLTIGSLLVAPAAAAAFVMIERRARSPLLPFRVLRARNTKVVSAAAFLIGAVWSGSLVVTPLLMQVVLGMSATMTSLATIPRNILMVVGAAIASRIGGRVGERRLSSVSCAGLGIIMGVMAFGASMESLAVLLSALACSGLIMSSGQPALISAIGHAVDPDDYGLATSLQQTSNQIGAVIGIGLFTAIAADATTSGPYVVNYAIAVVLCLAASVICLGIVGASTRVRPAESRTPE